MAENDPTTTNPSDNRIVARDAHGNELVLRVVEREGLVVIRASDDDLIMSPGAATQLCLELVEVLFRQRQRGEAGPLSSTF